VLFRKNDKFKRGLDSPGYQDMLGWGFGTALGVKVAKPDTPVLSISGDGGFMYQCVELATAALHDIAVVDCAYHLSLSGANVFRMGGWGQIRCSTFS